MATIADIIASARDEITDLNAKEWSDQHLGRHCLNGIRDLWTSITPLHEDYFTVLDNENFTLAANAGTITGQLTSTITNPDGLPSGIYKIVSITPRLDGSGSRRGLEFTPRSYKNSQMQAALRSDSKLSDYDSGEILYAIFGQGAASESAMRIYVAPRTASDLPLTVAYVRSIDDLLIEDSTAGLTTNVYADAATPAQTGAMGVNRWILMDDVSAGGGLFTVPSTGEGRVRFGYPLNALSGQVPGGTSTPTFQWADFNPIDVGVGGDSVMENEIALSFKIPHAGARPRMTGDTDYSMMIVDSSTVSLGKNADGRILFAVDSEIGLSSLFPISPLRIDNIKPTIATTGQVIKLNEAIPLPGHPDYALMCFTIAYARSREREDRSPDPTWLAHYSSHKSNIIGSLTPRQEFGHYIGNPSQAMSI